MQISCRWQWTKFCVCVALVRVTGRKLFCVLIVNLIEPRNRRGEFHDNLLLRLVDYVFIMTPQCSLRRKSCHSESYAKWNCCLYDEWKIIRLFKHAERKIKAFGNEIKKVKIRRGMKTMKWKVNLERGKCLLTNRSQTEKKKNGWWTQQKHVLTVARAAALPRSILTPNENFFLKILIKNCSNI